jgi:hypothetical protein
MNVELDTKRKLWVLLLKEDSDVCLRCENFPDDQQIDSARIIKLFGDFVGSVSIKCIDGGMLLDGRAENSHYYISVSAKPGSGYVNARLVRYLTKNDVEILFAVVTDPVIPIKMSQSGIDDIDLAVAKALYWLSHGVLIDDYLVSAVRKLGFARLPGTLIWPDYPDIGVHPTFIATLASKPRYLPCRLKIDCALPTKVTIEGEDTLVASVLKNFSSHT